MSLSARKHPITTRVKTISIYLITFHTKIWRRPWGGRHAFTLLVIGRPTFPLSSAWWARLIRFTSAHWSFLRSHLLGCGFLLFSSHSRLSSSLVWTSSPTGSTYCASTKWRSSRRPLEEERSPPALGHSTTSTLRHSCFTSSPCWAQTPR